MSDGTPIPNEVMAIARRLGLLGLGLKIAIGRAEEGHPGWTVDVLDAVNPMLEGTGYRLVKHQEPGTSEASDA